MEIISFTNGELYHHGVKGMKWGVRRYQNSDGSLTSAGKKRARRDLEKEVKNMNKDILRSEHDPYVPTYTKMNMRAKRDILQLAIKDLDKKDIHRGKDYIVKNGRLDFVWNDEAGLENYANLVSKRLFTMGW